jgi:hypothetical protein
MSNDPITNYYSNRWKTDSSGRQHDALGGTALMPTEAYQICDLVREHKPSDCIEIGTGLGASPKRQLRVVRHGFRRGMWFASKLAPHTHLNVIVLRKPISPSIVQ